MALKLLQPGTQPLGQFDGLDSFVASVKGGEVVTLKSSLLSANDKAAKDSFDGYTLLAADAPRRPLVSPAGTSDGYARPLMLADDGVAGYGTLFGSVVGGTVGQVVTGGAVLGPNTATGSGKITCWEKPGLYAVSLDAVDTQTGGLLPTNTNLDTGAALSFINGGLLTPSTSANAVAGSGPSGKALVGRFVDFETNGSLVTTPNNLASALAGVRTFSFATFYFNPSA